MIFVSVKLKARERTLVSSVSGLTLYFMYLNVASLNAKQNSSNSRQTVRSDEKC